MISPQGWANVRPKHRRPGAFSELHISAFLSMLVSPEFADTHSPCILIQGPTPPPSVATTPSPTQVSTAYIVHICLHDAQRRCKFVGCGVSVACPTILMPLLWIDRALHLARLPLRPCHPGYVAPVLPRLPQLSAP